MTDELDEELKALVEAHHSSNVRIPDSPWDEVIPGLWLGGSERGFPGGTFGAVISVYDWHKHRGRWLPKEGVPHVVVPFYDSEHDDPEEWEWLVHYLVEQIRFWRVNQGRTVLVRCQAGLNRSALVVAAYLIQEKGYAPRDAIAHLRKVRDENVLFNNTFREWLEGLV